MSCADSVSYYSIVTCVEWLFQEAFGDTWGRGGWSVVEGGVGFLRLASRDDYSHITDITHTEYRNIYAHSRQLSKSNRTKLRITCVVLSNKFVGWAV